MHLTVAICTWNRADLLDRTLNELRHVEIPPGVEWELLVVNNNCSDHTDAVLGRHASHLPLRRLFEETQGLSAARNRAVAEARGDLVVWTDDDVLVDRKWLAEYLDAANRWPTAGYFGGTIDPWFEVPPPRWVSENLDLLTGAMVIRQLGSFVGGFPEGELPFGANMAFRRAHLSGEPFDPRLGYVGGQLVSGDETDLFVRLREDRIQGIWVGTARVRHFIPRRRMTARFVWDWFAGYGRAEARRERNRSPVRTVLGQPAWAVRSWAENRLNSILLAPLSNRRWLRHYTRAAHALGVLRESAGRPRDVHVPALQTAIP